MTFLRHLVVSLVCVTGVTNIAEALLPLCAEPARTRRAIPDQPGTLTTVSFADKTHRVGRFGRHLPIAILLAAVMTVLLLSGCTRTDERGIQGFLTHSPNTLVAPANFAYGTRSLAGCSTSVAGSADVTTRLNAWLAKVPNGATVAFAPSACYRLDQTLFVRGHSNLTLEGNGATFKRISPTPPAMLYPNRNPNFFVQNESALTLKDFRIEGLNTVNTRDPWELDPNGFSSGFEDKAFEAGIEIIGGRQISITNVSIDAVFGDGITVGNEHAPRCTSDVNINSVDIDRNGRQGIAVICASRTLINQVKVLHSHATGIDLEPNGAGSHVDGVEIRQSYLNARTVSISSAGNFDISNVWVHDNTLGGWDPAYPWLCLCGPSTSPRHDWKVQNNRTLKGAVNRSTVRFLNVANVTFSDNTSISAGTRLVPSVELRNVTGIIRITNNALPGAPSTYSADAATSTVLACGNRLGAERVDTAC
jgi:hypothetical protein